MSVLCWRTAEPLEPAFADAWNATVSRLPYANFGFRLDCLEWNARHGVPSLAVLVHESQVTGAIVARFERGAWVSGLPWRWHAAVEATRRPPAAALTTPEAAVLFGHLARFARGERLRCYLPCPPPGSVPGFLAGKTILQSVDRTDDELLKAMDQSKRAAIKRAKREGYQVIEPAGLDAYRTFSRVQRETDARHGRPPDPEPGRAPAPGEGWREWELPWMGLLVAVRGDEVGSGFGFASGPGRLLESRASASTAEALKEGAFVLLAFEVAKRARARGVEWLNWGGDTFFKRDITGPLGAPVVMHCWLGGGARWALANASEAAWRNARARVAAALRGLRARRPGVAR